MKKLKPCKCGSRRLSILGNGIGDYYVRCRSCGERSSDVRCEDEDYAVERWNKYRGYEPEDEEY
jgi:hypothetical protein